jgi:hypothetical protein
MTVYQLTTPAPTSGEINRLRNAIYLLLRGRLDRLLRNEVEFGRLAAALTAIAALAGMRLRQLAVCQSRLFRYCK